MKHSFSLKRIFRNWSLSMLLNKVHPRRYQCLNMNKLQRIRSNSLLPAEGFNQSRALLCPDQNSEEQVDGPIEPEERWKLSPGFDVLLNSISETLVYEDESEYLLNLDIEAEIECMNRVACQREENVQCTKMMLKLLEEKIKRLELLSDGSMSAARISNGG